MRTADFSAPALIKCGIFVTRRPFWQRVWRGLKSSLPCKRFLRVVPDLLIRLMAGLLYLKYAFNESDERVCYRNGWRARFPGEFL